MKNINLLSIGETSRITGMHVKSLRYYDRMKVFTPEYVDPRSGYRYYSFEQLQRILAVRTCLDAGIILSDLERYSNGDSINYLSLIGDAKESIDREIKELERKRTYLDFLQKEVSFNNNKETSILRGKEFGPITLWRSPITEQEAKSFSRKETFVRLASEAGKKGYQLTPLYFGMMMTEEAGERSLFAIAGIEDFLNNEDDSENLFRAPDALYRREFRPDLDVTAAEEVFPELFAQDYDKVVITTVSLCSDSSEPVYSMFINLP